MPPTRPTSPGSCGLDVLDRAGDELAAGRRAAGSTVRVRRRLDPALEGGLTFGYYQPPGADGYGCYPTTARTCRIGPWLRAASVLCHEGIPGHHLQIGRQLENDTLHPIRRQLSNLRTFATNGFLEGWAEYAAGFCDEVAVSPTRSTGTDGSVPNASTPPGWSSTPASTCWAGAGGAPQTTCVPTLLSEVEIGTELIRYAVDDPGQALGYHLGHWFLRRLRGDTDPLSFHNAVLDTGQLPLRLLPDALGIR